MTLIATLSLALLVWVLLALATSVLVSLGWRLLEPQIEGLHPIDATRGTLLVACAPFALPTLIVGLCFVPGLLGLMGLPGDHCLHHTEHLHLCLAHHRVALTGALATWLIVASAAGVLLCFLAFERVARARRSTAFLEVADTKPIAPGVVEVDSPRPFCMTTGLLRPTVWISNALRMGLDERQQAAVIAHEEAHVRRHDPLVRLVASLLTTPLWPSVRRRILARLHVGSEQACDAAAAQAVGDRVFVAETLLAVARMTARVTNPPLGPTAPAFGDGAIPLRVQRLLDPGDTLRHPRSTRWIGVAAITALLAVLPIHHLIEHLVALLPLAG